MPRQYGQQNRAQHIPLLGRITAPVLQRTIPSEDVQDNLARYVTPGGCSILSDLRPEIHVRHAAERWRSCRRIRDAAPEAGGCEDFQEVLFKKYSQMKLQMKREALGKLNRNANESGKGSDTGRPN